MLRERWEGGTSFFLIIISSNNKITIWKSKEKIELKSNNTSTHFQISIEYTSL